MRERLKLAVEVRQVIWQHVFTWQKGQQTTQDVHLQTYTRRALLIKTWNTSKIQIIRCSWWEDELFHTNWLTGNPPKHSSLVLQAPVLLWIQKLFFFTQLKMCLFLLRLTNYIFTTVLYDLQKCNGSISLLLKYKTVKSSYLKAHKMLLLTYFLSSKHSF